MKTLELKETRTGFEVTEDGKAVGKVIKHSDTDYSYHSYRAIKPFDKGHVETEAGALAHLGYRRKYGRKDLS